MVKHLPPEAGSASAARGWRRVPERIDLGWGFGAVDSGGRIGAIGFGGRGSWAELLGHAFLEAPEAAHEGHMMFINLPNTGVPRS